MAQIIKHRRGSIGSVFSTTARNAELIVASGSINDLSGPFVFIGSPSTTDEGVAGAYKAVSKIYQGTNAPTIAAGTYGSTLDGTPFYSTNDQTLYILNRDNVGHTNMDLTGNLEGRSIDKITLSSLNGSINVTGSVVISQNISASGNISASNLELQGNANIKGNITLGGNINIGNQNSDLIVFGGEVSSSILPELHNEFDLGSPTQNWRNLHLSGTAFINTAKIVSISMDGAQVFDDLIVSGNTFLGDRTTDSVNITGSLNVSGSQTLTGSLSQLGDYNLVGSQRIQNNLTVSGSTFLGNNVTDLVNVTASFNVSGSSIFTGSVGILGQTTISSLNVADLTDNRIVLAGTSGEIEDDANLTFNGTELNIGTGNFKVQQASGNTNIAGTLNTVGAVGLNSTLEVTGSTLLKSTLEVVSSVGLNSTLTVTGSTLLKSNLGVTGSVAIDGVTTITNETQATDYNAAALVVAGGVGIGKNLWVSGSTTIMGDLTILGSSSIVNISASTLNIDDNIIRLNAYNPFQRYAGIEVMDSGSNNTSASILWDSTNDYWILVSGSTGGSVSGRAISTTYASQGSETVITLNTIPKATGPASIGNSLITDDGTSFAYNTDALVVTGSSGQTYIKGKVTLVHSGGTDANSNSSAMLFRNSSNELGYISTTATSNVLTGILGYREDNGKLEFSYMIDGGGF
jgi:hypothetical protein